MHECMYVCRLYGEQAKKRMEREALCTSGDYVCSLKNQRFVILWCKLHVMYEVLESSSRLSLLLIILFEILLILSGAIFSYLMLSIAFAAVCILNSDLRNSHKKFMFKKTFNVA